MRTQTVINEGRIDPECDPTHSKAAEWFAVLHDAEISVEQTMEWQRLMATDPQFAIAYARIEEVWNAFDGIRDPTFMTSEAETNDRYDGSISVSRWVAAKRVWRLPKRYSAMLAASIACLGVAAYWVLSGNSAPTQVLQTVVGQNQAFILADGSRLNLGADTRLEIRFNAASREVNLVRGEAFFAVAKDHARPFTVQAGNASVTAVGTQFSVNREAGQVLVAVVEGQVLVASGAVPNEGGAEKRPVVAGEQVLVGTNPRTSASLRNVAVAIGWQGGRLAFQSEPLSRVLEDVNRYATKPISVDDPSLGDLMVTGTASRDDLAGWLESLEKVFPVRIVEDSQRITIRSR
jgi:transmembrane sensor